MVAVVGYVMARNIEAQAGDVKMAGAAGRLISTRHPKRLHLPARP
ncbi:MAG: hypothetical protein OXH87_13815 [Rhodospirillaceae bacterium]|nr:hypothetical protein [Rhodospirillaceae bacterium]